MDPSGVPIGNTGPIITTAHSVNDQLKYRNIIKQRLNQHSNSQTSNNKPFRSKFTPTSQSTVGVPKNLKSKYGLKKVNIESILEQADIIAKLNRKTDSSKYHKPLKPIYHPPTHYNHLNMGKLPTWSSE